MYIPPYAGRVTTGYTFEDTVNRLKRKLQPMSNVPYVIETPHNNNQYWVRPDTTHNSTRDGLSYATAWGGFTEINWGLLGGNKTLWVCGQFDDQILLVDNINGSVGNYFDIRLDHSTYPGTIYRSVVIPTVNWISSGVNGEYYVTGYDSAEIMLFEDGNRLVGCSKTSKNTKNLRTTVEPVSCSIDIINDILTITTVERDFATGEKICIPNSGNLASIPAPLVKNVWYYAIAVSTNSIKFAASYSDAINNIAIDLTTPGTGDIWKLFHEKRGDGMYDDPEIGSLQPGQYWWDGELKRIYYKPTSGVLSNHEVRIADDRNVGEGAAILFTNSSYVRVFGGGEYGGLFGVTPVGKVGQCHTNAIHSKTSSYITVNGVQVNACRSGIAFVGGTGHSSKNNLVYDCGWHGIGGEGGAIVEDGLLHERNYIRDVGQKHDFGDTQGLVFNRKNHNSIIRRNLVQRVGRNSSEINAGAIVSDVSNNVYTYRNIIENCYGAAFRLGSGGAGCIFANNIITRQNYRYGNYATNQYFFASTLSIDNNGRTGFKIDSYNFWGNIIGNSRTPRPSWNNEYFGVVKLRTANNATAIINGITFYQNAVVNMETDPESSMFVVYTTHTEAPIPNYSADNNLYIYTNKFFTKRIVSDPVVTYDLDHSVGTGVGFYSNDTGNDPNSVVVLGNAPDFTSELSSDLLEFLRQDDSYDVLTPPEISKIGSFPFDV